MFVNVFCFVSVRAQAQFASVILRKGFTRVDPCKVAEAALTQLVDCDAHEAASVSNSVFEGKVAIERAFEADHDGGRAQRQPVEAEQAKAAQENAKPWENLQ